MQGLGRVLADVATGLQMNGARAALDEFSQAALSGGGSLDAANAPGGSADEFAGYPSGNTVEVAAKAATGAGI